MQEPREAQRYPTRFQYSKNAPFYTLSPKFINMLEKSWFSQTFPLAQETNKTEKLKLPILYRVTCSRKKVVGKQESRGWGIAAGAGLALCSPCRLSQDAGCPGLVPPRQHVLAMCSLQHQPWPASRCQLEQSILKNNYSNPLPDCPISGKQISAKEGQSMLCPNTDFFYSKDTQVPLSFPLSPAIPGEKYPAKQKRNEVKYALLLISW